MKATIRIALTLLIAMAVIGGGALLFLTWQRSQVAAGIERESPTAGITPVGDFGSTKTLEILPLVENAAAAPQYQSEHGVSYLIKTDSSIILMDLGFNPDRRDPSPLEHNMSQLGVQAQDVDTIVISHWHPDHTGGSAFWEQHTFAMGNKQIRLDDKRAFVPSPMTYPGTNPVVATQPIKIAQGVGLTGSMPFVEVMNSHALIPALADLTTGLPARNSEQALVVNISGRGLVLITGCGHPTMPKLVSRAQRAFSLPVVGVIGGLHYQDMTVQQVQSNIEYMNQLKLQLVGLSPHDSGPAAIQAFRGAFPNAYQEVQVGRRIAIGNAE